MLEKLAPGRMLFVFGSTGLLVYVLQPQFAMDATYVIGWASGLVGGWLCRSFTE